MAHGKKTLSGLGGSKKGKSRKAPKGWKVVGKDACTRKRKGRLVLKSGCKWGRGRYRGKLLKKAA